MMEESAQILEIETFIPLLLQVITHFELVFILFTKGRGYSNIKNYSTYQTNGIYLKQLELVSQVMSQTVYMGAQWHSGRVLDSRPRGCGFEPHRHHCVLVLEQDTFILA